MSAGPAEARLKPRNLLGILSFLRKYPARVALWLWLLMIIITIDMLLPQIVGNAITDLRRAMELKLSFSPWLPAQLLLSLILVRTGVAYVLGPIRNRTIQSTLGDIRAAIYDAVQRLPFAYHDKANSGELISRSTTDVWRLQDFLYACLFLSALLGSSASVCSVSSCSLAWIRLS